MEHDPNIRRELPPADVVACGARPDVPLCADCIDAYRNGIEPGESACDDYHDRQ